MTSGSIWTDLASGGARQAVPPETAAEVSKSVLTGTYSSITIFLQSVWSMPVQQLCLLAIAVYIATKMAQKRAAVQAASSKARMQALHDGAQQYSVSESFTAGWVNVLLRQLWPTVIEAKGSEVAKKGLQKVLNKVLNEQGNKGPLRFLEGIEVEEVTLGMVPPRLHVCHARFSPSHNYLQLETEADIYSSGFQLIIVPSMKATPLTGAVKGRVAVTHFSGRAHLLLGFHLFSRSPGIKSIDISFLEPPVFDVRLTPMGVTVTDFPGVLAAIKSQLAKLMAKQMVEPKRKTIDIEKIWLDKRAEKGSGPGGMLCLTLVQARDLWYPGTKPKSGAEVDAYVEIRYSGEVFRTPCVRGSPRPSWNWQFDVRLPEPPKGHAPGSAGSFRIDVLDARATGDPGLLGTANVDLADLNLQANQAAEAFWLPLKGSQQGAVQLAVQLLMKEKPPTPGPLARSGTARARTLVEHAAQDSKGGPATVADVIEGKEELVGLLAAEKSRRRMAEERFAAALSDMEKLRGKLKKVEKSDEQQQQGGDKRDASPQMDNFSPGQKMRHDGSADGGPPQGPRYDADPETAASRAPGDMLEADAMAPNQAQNQIREGGSRQQPGMGSRSEGQRGYEHEQRPDAPLLPNEHTINQATRAAMNANLDRPDRSDQAEPRSENNPQTHQQQYDRHMQPSQHISDGPQAAAYPDWQRGRGRPLDQPPEADSGHREQQEIQAAGRDPVSRGLVRDAQLARVQPNADVDALLSKLAKLERKLGEEEEGRRGDVARAEARIRSLEGEMAAEHKRRLSEQLRALVQGAPFIFHKAHSAEQRTIWFSPAKSVLRWATHRLAGNGEALQPSSPARNGSSQQMPEPKERHVSVKKIIAVDAGLGHFPKRDGAGAWEGFKGLIPGLNKKGPEKGALVVDEARALSICFNGNTALHLELPPQGNGRSRQEWLVAFQDLADHHYQQEIGAMSPRND